MGREPTLHVAWVHSPVDQPEGPVVHRLWMTLLTVCWLSASCWSLTVFQILIAKSPVAPFAVLNYTIQDQGICMDGEWRQSSDTVHRSSTEQPIQSGAEDSSGRHVVFIVEWS